MRIPLEATPKEKSGPMPNFTGYSYFELTPTYPVLPESEWFGWLLADALNMPGQQTVFQLHFHEVPLPVHHY